MSRYTTSGISGEWWEANAKPLINAIGSWDIQVIREAVYNAPWTYFEYIQKVYDPEKRKNDILTEDEIDELCKEWEPEPLVTSSMQKELDESNNDDRLIVEGCADAFVKVKGINKPLLNFATFDFLGFASRLDIKDAVASTLKKYGCGSCGPRGFYGTIDTHEHLEKSIAAFLGTDDAIIYSDSDSTVTSVLPAFAKRGDLVVIDQGCNDSILVGGYLSRSKILYYKHNDLDDLERILKGVREQDRKAGRGSNCQRRYVVTEGLFRNSGHIVDLPRVLSICEKYFFRIILDESYSFGVLGATGRGITEHFGVNMAEVDIVCSSLSKSIGSVGGFGTGSQMIVDYQRINSAGYVFSASAPPFTSTASLKAIEILRKEPELVQTLQANAKYMNERLSSVAGVVLANAPVSPIIHLRLDVGSNASLEILANDVKKEKELRAKCKEILKAIQKDCMASGLAVAFSEYKANQQFEPLPSIRLITRSLHTKKHIDEAIEIIQEVVAKQMGLKSTRRNTNKNLAEKESAPENEVSAVDSPKSSNSRRSSRRIRKASD